MTEKRFTTVELPKPNRWGIWYDGAYLSTYQVCILLNEYVGVKKENEQLRKEIERKEKIIQDKSELVRQQVNVSENLQARINILERALEEEEWQRILKIWYSIMSEPHGMNPNAKEKKTSEESFMKK